MEFILNGLPNEIALVYLDDFFIFGRTFKEHLRKLKLIMGQQKVAALRITGKEMHFFFQKEHQFLSFLVSNMASNKKN